MIIAAMLNRESDMPQVIIVSNRLPVSVKKEDGVLHFFPSVGGLATGLSSYVNKKNSLWIGWPGVASDELTEDDRRQIVDELAKQNCSPVFLSQKQIDDFYNGFSNTVLWPLLHMLRPQDHPGKQRDKWYQSYEEVNKLFAETAEIAASNEALIWVHDYQLMLVPGMLQDMKIDATIGFFLHVPFPSPKKFLTLPRHKVLLEGISGADVIGFHTSGYVDNFLETCRQAGIGTPGEQTLLLKNRTIRVSDFPMGIDYEKYSTAGKIKEVKAAVKVFKAKYRGLKTIVAVDRLDMSKGLMERLNAYDNFLKKYPNMYGKVVYIMVAAPSRTDVPAYQRLAKRLDKKVVAINAHYGTQSWNPIDYVHRSIPFEEVTALFQIADVAFIAPLRDGMNLAAKEYVASARSSGALILSETAGAAEELRDALLVNPRKSDSVVAALNSSLTMKRNELKKRLSTMRLYLQEHTVQKWANSFVTTMQRPIPGTISVTLPLLKKQSIQLMKDYGLSHSRLILLDYDGTLVPFVKNYREATPPDSLKHLLDEISKNPNNDVVIVSGRSAEDLEAWFGKLNINLIAEHGARLRMAGTKKWQVIASSDTEWKKIIKPTLEKYAALTPEARVEEKQYSLVWHYRGSPPYYAQKYSVIIRHALNPILSEYGLTILKGNKVLEIKSPQITKGNAIIPWLDKKHDFVFAAGDDTTDEQMFEELPRTSYSVKVGRGRTAASYRVTNNRDIIKLLQKFAESK